MAATTDDLQPVENYIEYAWTSITQQISNGNLECVYLPSGFKTIIWERGINILTDRYSELVGFHVTITEDTDAELLILRPTSRPLHTSPSPDDTVWSPGPTISNPDDSPRTTKKVTRPPNAFILYRADRQSEIKEACPYLINSDISIIIGAEWNEASAEVRKKYQTLAETYKKQHQQEHPEYAYQPRKPGNKKSRVTSKKTAALTQMAHNLNPQPSAVVSNTFEDTIPMATSFGSANVFMDTQPGPFSSLAPHDTTGVAVPTTAYDSSSFTVANDAGSAEVTTTGAKFTPSKNPYSPVAKESLSALHSTASQENTLTRILNARINSGPASGSTDTRAVSKDCQRFTPRSSEHISQGIRISETGDPSLPEMPLTDKLPVHCYGPADPLNNFYNNPGQHAPMAQANPTDEDKAYWSYGGYTSKSVTPLKIDRRNTVEARTDDLGSYFDDAIHPSDSNTLLSTEYGTLHGYSSAQHDVSQSILYRQPQHSEKKDDQEAFAQSEGTDQ